MTAPVAAARVIALGQRAAGDDAVGPAVLDRLRAGRRLPPGTELLEVPDAAALVSLLADPRPAVLVDAAIATGAPAGEVIVAREADLDRDAPRPLSSHGLAVERAVALARALAGAAAGPDAALTIVAVAIDPPGPASDAGLSPAVAAAVPRAAAAVLGLLAAGLAE